MESHLRRKPWSSYFGSIAVALVIYGIVSIIRGQILLGIVLIIVGLLVGPGGVSIFDDDDDDLDTSHPGGSSMNPILWPSTTV